jgi:hypothetical protein
MVVNGVGAVATCMVMLIFAITKFSEGAWIVLVLTPILVAVFWSIHLHYRSVADKLSLEHYGGPGPHMPRHRVIIPMSGIHRGSLEALRYARMLSDDVTAVHILVDPADAEKLQRKWEKWGDGVRLVVLDSPYRQFIEPLLDYINELMALRQPNEVITVVVPQFVSATPWEKALHTNTASILREELLTTPGIVITDVPYIVSDKKEEE